MPHILQTISKMVILAAILLMIGCSGDKETSPSSSARDEHTVKTQADTMKMLVSSIRKCSRLYTTEFHVHRIITHNDNLRLKGSILGLDYNLNVPAGSRRIAIPINATLKGYIDFEDFSDANVLFDDGKIELILPDPKVELISTKIDREEVKSYVALLRSDFTDEELSGYEKEGRASILASIDDLKISDRARQNATHVLIPILRQLGFVDDEIVITFRKDFDEKSLRRSLE